MVAEGQARWTPAKTNEQQTKSQQFYFIYSLSRSISSLFIYLLKSKSLHNSESKMKKREKFLLISIFWTFFFLFVFKWIKQLTISFFHLINLFTHLLLLLFN